MNVIYTKGSARVRSIILILIDAVCFVASILSYLFLHIINGSFSLPTLIKFFAFGLILLCVSLLLRRIFGAYANTWRYANSKSYLVLIMSDFSAMFLTLLVLRLAAMVDFFNIYPGFWQCLTVGMTYCFACIIARLFYQLMYRRTNVVSDESTMIRVAIVGAGQIGSLLADELILNPNANYLPVCFVDYDVSKIGSKVRDLPVYAEDETVYEKLREKGVQEIFLALPTADGDTISELMAFYGKMRCRIKVYGLPTDGSGDGKRKIRDIKPEDLLFRDDLVKENEDVDAYYRDKTVLVTGGGGSIGSELCRQIAKRHPKKLIILDIYENNAYDIEQELKSSYPGTLDLAVEIASVRDVRRLESVFEMYRPQIVFHAAAHKHVPLMEHSAVEAVKNNVLGTLNTVNAAEKYGVLKFIMISTDKAVNPTNVMGASKRMCEMIIQSRIDSNTVFSCVRFGNVLGSNGSVIPLFKRQIEAGGPVTLTDKRIIRYFMTIPEASQLVMEAGAMANRGELFVLDMGKPVKILELAENMIRLAGLEPYKDIDICEVGLRPGEKLYEELLIKNENLDKTDNGLIFIERDRAISRGEAQQKIDLLCEAVENAETTLDFDLVKNAMKQVVPTFCDPDEINKTADEADEMRAVVTV